VGVEVPDEFGQIGPGLKGGGGEPVLVLGDGVLVLAIDGLLEGGQTGLLAGAARLFVVHDGLGGPGELGRGQGLTPPGHHGLLDGQGAGERLPRLLVLLLSEKVEGLPEGVGRLGRASVGEQHGLVAQEGAVAGAAGGIVDAKFLGEFGDDGLDLDAELGPPALDPQRQRVTDLIRHAGYLAERSVQPVPAAHLGDRPAQPQRGQHVVGVVHDLNHVPDGVACRCPPRGGRFALLLFRLTTEAALAVIAGPLGLQSPDWLTPGLVPTTSLPQRRTPDYIVATTT